ncbi:ABC transporter permease, partial [Azotobacter chroococcum]|nr:ABC transporter permease [Azotobacter chroococcum]
GVGGALAWVLVQAFNRFGARLFEILVEPTLIPGAMAVATLTGVLAAAVPARRAARYDPAVAIRYV